MTARAAAPTTQTGTGSVGDGNPRLDRRLAVVASVETSVTAGERPGTLSAGTDAASRSEAHGGRFLPGLAGAFGLRPLLGGALALAVLVAGTAAPQARGDAPVTLPDLCLPPKPVEVRLVWTIAGRPYAVSVCHAIEPAFDPRIASRRLRRPHFLAEAR